MIIFYDLNHFKTERLSIKFFTPGKENTIYQPTLLHEGKFSGYFSVLRDPKTRDVKMFYRAQTNIINTHHISYSSIMISKDGINFDKPVLNKYQGPLIGSNNIILNEVCACHNFSVSYDCNSESKDILKLFPYKGIGGLHLLESDFSYSKNKHIGCESHTTLVKSYPPKDCKFDVLIPYVNPKGHHKCQGNGIYAYLSKNGIDWIRLKNEPIITGIHENYFDKFAGIMTLDSFICWFYNSKDKLYYMYVRANQGRDIRYIQYTTSPNFIKWSRMKLIKTTPAFNEEVDNYYQPSFIPYPGTENTGDYFIGMIPYYSKQNTLNNKRDHKAWIYLAMSTDGINWKMVHKLWHTGGFSEPFMKAKNSDHSVKGIIVSNSGTQFYIYKQNNYYAYEELAGTHVDRYSLRKDGFCALEAGAHPGIVKMRIKIQNKKIGFNFNGTLNIYFEDKHWKIQGNYVEHSIMLDQEVGFEGDMKIELAPRTYLYSISGLANL